jgi:mono/diheme cytochrome c family protein
MCAAVLVAATAAVSIRAADPPAGAVQAANTWVLGEDAETKTNPMPADEKTLATGRAIFKDKCQRCHGPGGLGDGPDSDPDSREYMDLTNPERADRNVDGVVYYKVLNGRRRPKMPTFKEELTEQQIWAVVTYVQSLRKKP